MATLFDPFFQAIDGNGAPISGAKLNFYLTGTTTRKDTYSQSDLAVGHENTNPVVADSNGRFGPIYLAQDEDYKAVLTDADDVTLGNGTLDPLLVIHTSVITTEGDIIVGNSMGQDSRLAVSATNGARLTSNGTTPVWRVPAYTVQVKTSGSGTYTTPANCTAIRVRIMAGGGGGGGTGGTTGPTGASGGGTTFGPIAVNGAVGGTGNALTGAAAGGAGGTGGSGTATFRISGGSGNAAVYNGTGTQGTGGAGGNGAFGGGAGASAGTSGAVAGVAAATNSGGGGSGAASAGTTTPAGGGGAGEYAELMIANPSATYVYSVGAGGAGGVGTGTAAATGGAGGSGIVIVEEFYA